MSDPDALTSDPDALALLLVQQFLHENGYSSGGHACCSSGCGDGEHLRSSGSSKQLDWPACCSASSVACALAT